MEKAIENQVAEVDKIMKTIDGSVDASVDETVDKTVEEVIERPYTLRKLQDGDLYPLLQLLRKLGLKDFKDAFNAKKIERMQKINAFNPDLYETDEEKAKAIEDFEKSTGYDVFFDMADVMISKIDTHKDAIYGFYSDLAGVAPEEIMQMEFGTLPLMIYDSFSEVKNTAFFKVLSKLL